VQSGAKDHVLGQTYTWLMYGRCQIRARRNLDHELIGQRQKTPRDDGPTFVGGTQGLKDWPA
jgi:hypothetical protein